MYIYIHVCLATELAGFHDLEVAITQYNYHYVPGLKPKVSLQSSANISCLADLRTGPALICDKQVSAPSQGHLWKADRPWQSF